MAGWITYYGRFYRSKVITLLARLNRHLERWASHKYKGYTRRKAAARFVEVATAWPRLFAHWHAGAHPRGWATGAV